jgi:hypothetical protein
MFGGMLKNNIDDFFSKLEWRWSLANLLWGAGLVASATVPAWAVATMEKFAAYAPLSWVLAGLSGFLVFCLGFYVYALARERVVWSRYNDRSLERGGNANPMEKTFEKKRVFLNEFCLPSNPFVHDKIFIDCEIVGPANIHLRFGNNVSDSLLPRCDAAVLPPEVTPGNAYSFTNCVFRRCSFQRVTFFVSQAEYENAKDTAWLNWISTTPDLIQAEMRLPMAIEDQSAQSPEGTPTETQP